MRKAPLLGPIKTLQQITKIFWRLLGFLLFLSLSRSQNTRICDKRAAFAMPACSERSALPLLDIACIQCIHSHCWQKAGKFHNSPVSIAIFGNVCRANCTIQLKYCQIEELIESITIKLAAIQNFR